MPAPPTVPLRFGRHDNFSVCTDLAVARPVESGFAFVLLGRRIKVHSWEDLLDRTCRNGSSGKSRSNPGLHASGRRGLWHGRSPGGLSLGSYCLWKWLANESRPRGEPAGASRLPFFPMPITGRQESGRRMNTRKGRDTSASHRGHIATKKPPWINGPGRLYFFRGRGPGRRRCHGGRRAPRLSLLRHPACPRRIRAPSP